jgi:3-phenylpropionate/cinnamic acid dioxygenase small subunit
VEEDDDSVMSHIATNTSADPAGGEPIGFSSACEFAWREAALLDALDYTTWLTLWTDSGLYVIPTDRHAQDFAGSLNIAYDDDVMRRARVKRLSSGYSMAASPAARTVRTVSRFVASERSEDRITLQAGMILVEYKYERMRVIAADVEYRILRVNGELKLDGKVIRLINADEHQFGVGYVL